MARIERDGEETTDAVRYFSRSFNLAGAEGDSLNRTEAELLLWSVVVLAETCKDSSRLPGTAVGWKGRLM